MDFRVQSRAARRGILREYQNVLMYGFNKRISHVSGLHIVIDSFGVHHVGQPPPLAEEFSRYPNDHHEQHRHESKHDSHNGDFSYLGEYFGTSGLEKKRHAISNSMAIDTVLHRHIHTWL